MRSAIGFLLALFMSQVCSGQFRQTCVSPGNCSQVASSASSVFRVGAKDSDGAVITAISPVAVPRAPEAPPAMEGRSFKTSRAAILASAQKALDEKQISDAEMRAIRLATLRPRVLSKVESLVAEKAYVEGYAIPMGSDGEFETKSIDWNSLVDFIQTVLPLILKLIALFS